MTAADQGRCPNHPSHVLAAETCPCWQPCEECGDTPDTTLDGVRLCGACAWEKALAARGDREMAKSDASAALWAIHEAAMDASAEPTRQNIRAVQKAVKRMERLLPAHYAEMLEGAISSSRGGTK